MGAGFGVVVSCLAGGARRGECLCVQAAGVVVRTVGEEARGMREKEEKERLRPARETTLTPRPSRPPTTNRQVLSLCLTGTNTLSSLLAQAGTSLPAFQVLLNYLLLNIIYTSITVYRYGFRKWATMVVRDGWRYFILAFLDALGNYFTVCVLSPSVSVWCRAPGVLLTCAAGWRTAIRYGRHPSDHLGRRHRSWS